MGAEYLEAYAKTVRTRKGVLASPAFWLRNRLDRLAIEKGEADRFGLFLPRAAELCGLPLTNPFTVLELGAGAGVFLRCNRPGLRKIAVDIADTYADAFNSEGILFYKRDIGRETLPFADRSIDMVMMNHVIEHIVSPDHVLQECARVLKVNGGLYIRTPNIERVGHRFWDDYTHVHPYTVSSLRHAAEAFGFSVRNVLASDHTRMSLDLLTNGKLRRWLFASGNEMEAALIKH